VEKEFEVKQWYYLLEEQQKGPISETALTDLIASGLLPPETLVRSEESEAWNEARIIKGLLTSFHHAVQQTPPPPPPPAAPPKLMRAPSFAIIGLKKPRAVKKPKVSKDPSGRQIRPWVRLWARLTDYILFLFFLALIDSALESLKIINHSDFPSWFGVLSEIAFYFVFVFIEALMLSTFGTTPGKDFMKIRLRNNDGSLLSFSDALGRSLSVWIRGWAIGIPVLNYILCFSAYRRLKDKGVTYWDEKGNYTVSHQIIGPVRSSLATIIFIILYFQRFQKFLMALADS